MTDLFPPHKNGVSSSCAGHPVFVRPVQLTADHAGVQLTAAAAVLELAPEVTPEAEEFSVSGLVLPYGPVGYTSVGPVRVPDSSRVEIPEDLTRVKLMDYHQTPAVAIGYCTGVRQTTEGLRASFRVANTPAGRAARQEIQERVRDGLSVELGAIDVRGDELMSSQLLGVALVPIPAWDAARHDGLAAARTEETTTRGATSMTPEQRARLAELVALNGRTDEEEAEYAALVRQLVTSESPDDSADANPELQAAFSDAARILGLPTTAPATVPVGVPAPVRTGQTAQRTARRPVRELYAAMARVLSGHSRPELEAALSDITATANIWVAGDEYGGQLWSGLEYQRRFVPLLTGADLTNYKGSGWRWVTKPEVADYAGDKAPVPSNLAETEATAWAAARLAGAHDIDRKFWDFGDTEFIAAYYAAMTESYAVKSDGKALARILAMAAANAAILGGATVMGASLRAANAVMESTGGVKPDYFLVNSGDLIAAAEDGSLDAMRDSAALEAFGVTPDKFMVAPGVAAGTVVTGVKQAARWRELGGGSPIRVETINITNGGIDGGVFGYYATEAVHDEGVQRATFA